MKHSQGFTLIETLIYLALFAIVIGGGMIAVYQIIQSTDATNNKVIVQEEANFLLRKINWALTGATAVSVPSGTNLLVTKPISGTNVVLSFNLTGSNLTLQRDSGTVAVLNSSSLKISAVSFTKTSVSGQPDAIIAAFTLTSALNGRNDTENFTTTKYLRK